MFGFGSYFHIDIPRPAVLEPLNTVNMNLPKFRGRASFAKGDYFKGEWVEGCLIYNLNPHFKEDKIREAYIRTPLGNLSNTIEIDIDTIEEFVYDRDQYESITA